MTSKMEMSEKEVQVSVICISYNHEKYIRDTLNGIFIQKTNFRYEVIVHDDASTDGTAAIIMEYAAQYPDTIIPICQTKNQYSQGIPFLFEYILPKVNGKYIAYCEGDDYWTDPLKLQRQYDFLEKNPKYVACGHNVILVEDDNRFMTKDSPLYSKYFETYTDMIDHDYTLEELGRQAMYGQTCTRMYRNFWNNLPKDFKNQYILSNEANEDLKLSLLCYCLGKVRCMSGKYAHHRKSVINDSYTARMRGKNQCRQILKGCLQLEQLAEYFHVFPDFSPVYAGNVNAAWIQWFQKPCLKNIKIFIYTLFHTPNKVRVVQYDLKILVKKLNTLWRGAVNGRKF